MWAAPLALERPRTEEELKPRPFQDREESATRKSHIGHSALIYWSGIIGLYVGFNRNGKKGWPPAKLPNDSPGGVDLWQSALEWEQIAMNLSTGMNVGQAVAAANQYLQNHTSLFQPNPAEAWLIVGDSNVQFKP
jgi:hypothetical protein